MGGNGENQERSGKMLKNPEQDRKNPKKSGIKNWNRCNIIAKLANIGWVELSKMSCCHLIVTVKWVVAT